MKTPNTICTDKERVKEELTQFAIAVNREVCMRMGGFKPANESEWQQQRESVRPMGKLDLVRELLPQAV
jgi:ABC-type amino acid transport substrate-binding protein